MRTAIAASPRDAGLYYALGLTLTRLKRTDEAMAELRRAAELEPDRARYAYVYAVALHSAGRREQAIAVLKENLTRHPEDRDTLLALVTFSRDAGRSHRSNMPSDWRDLCRVIAMSPISSEACKVSSKSRTENDGIQRRFRRSIRAELHFAATTVCHFRFSDRYS